MTPLGWLLPALQLATPAIQAEISRLEGQAVEVADDGASYRIVDIAGDGAPVVGRIERRGQQLWLVASDGAATRLSGPLAVPRIAGPGYKVWVIGSQEGNSLRARRIGVLAPPLAEGATQ